MPLNLKNEDVLADEEFNEDWTKIELIFRGPDTQDLDHSVEEVNKQLLADRNARLTAVII